MSTRAFQNALIQRPLSQQERASLTSDELFVLIAAGRLHGLTEAEQRRLAPGDLRELASAGLIDNIPASVAVLSQRLR
jgi:hypothetical protein